MITYNVLALLEICSCPSENCNFLPLPRSPFIHF